PGLFARAARIPGGEQLEATRRGTAAQLGFDPLTRDGLASAGLDPDRGAAVAVMQGDPRPGWVAALPVANQDAFAKTLDRILRERAGFADRSEEIRSGTRIAIFSRPGVAEKIAHGFARGYAVVARGRDPAAEVAAAAARRAEESLLPGERLRAAREDVGPQDLTVLATEGTLGFRGAAARALPGTLPGETAIGLTGTSGGVAAKLGAVVDYGLLDWRTRSPFESLQLLALAPVADEARLSRALESLAKALPKAGGEVRRTSDGWQVRYAGGEGPRFGLATVAGR